MAGRRDRPTLTLFCGLPGAGKTRLARRLEAEGRGVRLCTDLWQAQLEVEPADHAFHERLQAALHEHALVLLRHGTDVILEDGLWTKAERAVAFADARDCGAEIEWHVFDVALPTLWSRLQQRNAGQGLGDYPITFDELERAWAVFQPPDADELAMVDRHTLHH